MRQKTRQFLIISLLIHALVFMLATYIVLPPGYKPSGFLELYTDIVKIEPVVREIISRPAKVEPEEKTRQEEKKELQSTRLPEPITFSPPMIKIADSHMRVTSTERTIIPSILPKVNRIILPNPGPLQFVPRSIYNKDKVIIPSLTQEAGNIADRGGTTGFPGSQVGPIGSRADAKGQSLYYVDAVITAINPLDKVSEFENILPSLARGILERVTQKRIDVVFIIDTTGSMEDNVRGVKDYIHRFLEPLEEKGLDAELGLVEFSDQAVKKAKVVGTTHDLKTFRKWLDKTKFYGGRDLPESGYEALITALEKVNFRKSAQWFFIFISDAPQHDLDYDGMSRYSLDRIITILNEKGVSVDVVGADFLPVKQLAWGTGGQWKHIPGGDPLLDIPGPVTSLIRSSPGRSLQSDLLEDRVTVGFNDLIPDWVDLSCKILGPYGHKILGTLTYRKEINKAERSVEFSLRLDLSEFKDRPGIYTLIYRTRDSLGKQDVLRQTFQLD